MNLIDLSIRRPVFAWILMIALIVFGAFSLSKMGISQMPDVDFPILNISVPYPGAAPEIVESDLLDKIEQRLLGIEGVKEMRSSAVQGSASVTLEFDINRDVNVALQEVVSALSQLRLPPGVDPPVVRKQNPEEDPIIILAVYGDQPLREVLNWTRDWLLDQIRFVPGVGEVSIGGFPDRNLRIWLDPGRLRKNDLTISDVVEALKVQHVESAAGQFVDGKRELRVRWLGEASDPDEVGDIRILKRGGQLIDTDRIIRVKDVSDVEDDLADIRRMARTDGKTAVSIQVRKQRGTNEVEIAEAVRQKLTELKSSFPKGYDYRVVVDYTRNTKSTVHLTMEKLWVASIITILVCFLFLGSFQSAINILFSIPTSLVGAFIFLYFMHFTLNLFSLLALTLAVSIVVDDAIMLLENIVRHYRMGKTPHKAASDGAKEVLPAATASTLAVLAVFLPVIFMSGVIGKFFFQFGVTMSVAVLISLLEAVTITPMRAAAFLSTSPGVSKFEEKLDHLFHGIAEVYKRVLTGALRWKYTIVMVSAVFFGISLFLVTKLRQEFVPSQDQELIIVTAQTPPGSSLEATNAVGLKLEEVVRAQPEVTGYMISIGAGGPQASVNSIFMPLTLSPRDSRPLSHTQIMEQMRGKFRQVKGVRVSMRDISARNLTTGRLNPVAFNLRGPSLDILSQKTQEIIKRLEEEKLAVDLDTDYRTGFPELLIHPDRVAMGVRGVSVQSVAELLQAALGTLQQGEFTSDGRRYDIRYKIPDRMIRSPEDLKKIYVRNGQGNIVPLGQLVEIKEQGAAQSISRINRSRSVSVYGNLAAGQSQSHVLDRTREIAREILPTGYTLELEGAAAGFNEAFKSLYLAMAIGIIVAYMILAIQFNSFILPVSILMALPFSITGALVILWLTGSSMNLFSFIGMIVLMGIAKKNSIMLIEFANQLRDNEGKKEFEAIIEAGGIRLRPIIMTSVATIAAALPLIFGGGLGVESRQPMGLTIAGGTLVSTIFTLFVVPAIFLILSRLESRKKIEI